MSSLPWFSVFSSSPLPWQVGYLYPLFFITNYYHPLSPSLSPQSPSPSPPPPSPSQPPPPLLPPNITTIFSYNMHHSFCLLALIGSSVSSIPTPLSLSFSHPTHLQSIKTNLANTELQMDPDRTVCAQKVSHSDKCVHWTQHYCHLKRNCRHPSV